MFLHGGGGTLEDFDSILNEFSDHHCVLMDSRGHGGSTLGDEELNYPRLARDAEAVAAAFHLDRPVVVGHSDGGIAAIHMAAAERFPLGGIVLLAAHAEPPPDEILETVYAKLTADRWGAKFPREVALYEKLNPEPSFDRFFGAVLAMWRNTAPGNYPGKLAEKVNCPALILGGDADHLVPRAATLALGEAIRNSDLGLLPFASHVVFQEHPHRVLPFMIDFISRRIIKT